MIASAPSLPGSRELAGLWRQLSLPDAATCWIGQLFVHHVEAAVLVQAAPPRAPLELAALRALGASDSATTADLDHRLVLGPALVRQLLRQLLSDRLVERAAGESWRLSTAGRQLLSDQPGAVALFQRSVFNFLQRPGGALCYLKLRRSGEPLREAPPGWSFTPQVLIDCLGQSADWKARHEFPEAVTRIVTVEDDRAQLPWDVPSWQRVMLDRAEQLTLALVVQGPSLRGYEVDPRTWKLAAAEPALVLSDRLAQEEAFGELLHEPDSESWHIAWKQWCADHGVPLAEAAGIRFVRRGAVLQVTGHPLRPERLRSLAADPAQPESWLLAGTGPFWCAARLEFATPRGGR